MTIRRIRSVLALAGVSVLAVSVTAALAPAASAATDPTGLYIVQLADQPVASYAGTVTGYPATRPARGRKLRVSDASVNLYRGRLRAQHASVAARVPRVSTVYDYTLTFNGFAARMPASSAAALARSAGVLTVTKNEIRTADTITTPAFLGLSAPGGLWSQLGGPGPSGAGTDIVIGDIDTGISPDNPSFAALSGGGAPPGFTGTCQAARDASWSASDCTNKIVGARYYDAGLGGDSVVLSRNPHEYLSARDWNGHGSHTAGTAAGDYNVPVVIEGTTLGNGSGMAPNARIAVYKALWDNGTTGSGSTLDLVQAIEDATSDGVDVINYSISGSTTSAFDPVQSAFFNAAAAGIFVATSAGNSGPTAGTVEKNDPWVTTVAAGTQDRSFQASVTLGNGATYTGVGVGAAVPSSPVVLSANAGLGSSGSDLTGSRLCFSSTWTPGHGPYLDPAKVAGKIVVCDRGTNDRVDKSKAVQEAGGVGMILVNTSPNTLNADFHSVPTVHLNDVDGAAVKAYVSGTANPTASLAAGHAVGGLPAPQVASFSSRGPARAVGGDILKPDIMAPGVDIIAAMAPLSHNGRNFDFDSGTSMASPHIAGIAALIKQAHPTWSPMAIKSALLTSASTLDNKGNPITTDTGAPAGAFDYGSGEVTPNSAVDPGLVYDSSSTDWTRFLCGAGELATTTSSCVAAGSIDPSDLNAPNLSIGSLVGTQTVTRTVTNVGGVDDSYTVTTQAPAGTTLTVQPSTLTFSAAHPTATYTVTIARTSGSYGTFALGSYTWQSGTHAVRSQVAVRTAALEAPAEIDKSGVAGSTTFPVRSGYTGTLTTAVNGLVPATLNTGTLTNPTGAPFPTSAPSAGPHTLTYNLTVAAGSPLLRVETSDSDVPTGTDLDIYVYRGATLVGSSAGATAAERVDVTNPPGGTYTVYVDLFALASGVTTQPVKAYSWAVSNSSAGNLTVAPSPTPVTAGATQQLTATWTGLTAGTKYLGVLLYNDDTSTIVGRTVVSIDAVLLQNTIGLTLSPNPGNVGVPFTATVTVSGPPGVPPATGTVNVSDGVGHSCVVTLSGGTGSCQLTETAAGSFTITAVYGGDANYVGSTGTAVEIIGKIPTTTTLTVTPANPAVNQAVTLDAAVAPTGTAGPQPPSGTVTFTVDGALLATVPLSSGHAVVVTTLGGGSHAIVATYSGDTFYEGSSSASVPRSVACTATITGSHSSVTASSGTVCLRDATITGGISVGRGAVIDLENTTVQGAITANAPASVRICGSHTQSITVSGATGFVLIGDPAHGCAANTVAGNIVAANNKGGLVIVGNTVSGSVTVSGNSGAGPLPGQTGPIVSGNHH